MPLYEYACQACGHRFEVLQRLGEGAAGLTCPACGHGQVRRQLSTFAAGGDAAAPRAAASPGCCGSPFT